MRVAGWVHRRRDHGGLIFVDLRDRTGLVQLVFNPDAAGDAHELGHRLRSEDVVSAAGEVVRRDPEMVNPEIPTGEFEVRVAEADQVADAETPPFEIESFSGEVGEEVRLRYRYLDMRREPMRASIEIRHRVTPAIREFLDGEGFLEVETPVLTRSTPEGARDFLVPCRLQPGSFYALPQSPQLFKQLLMVAGFERYYQIARCFRDEDMRADRQPDFTQLDIEMAVRRGGGRARPQRAPAGAGSRRFRDRRVAAVPAHSLRRGDRGLRKDKPDTRYGLELRDLTDFVRQTEFNAFRATIEGGGVVRGLNLGPRELSRGELDGLVAEAQELGAKGLVWAVVEADGWRSPVAEFLSAEEIAAMTKALEASEGHVVALVADRPQAASAVLGALRRRFAERFDLVPAGSQALCWVVDWPLFEWSEAEGRWDPLHHPFTSPAGELDPADPAPARALAYDVVWNGVELGGGSIRINRPDVQRAVFEVLGIGPDEAEARFGFLLEALRYGAPPHGGIAYGLDRWVAELHGTDSRHHERDRFPGVRRSAAPTPAHRCSGAWRSRYSFRELGIQLRRRG